MAFDAGVSFRMAETEHGASPARSATDLKFTVFFLSGTSLPRLCMALHPPHISSAGAVLRVVDDSVRWTDDDPFVGKIKLRSLILLCDLAEEV